MNILYISHLSTNIAAGLNWSVPAGIRAQEKIDNCLWVDIYNKEMDHWRNTQCFHKLNEFGEELHLNILPEPFNHPDLVVFEGFYEPKESKFAKELRKSRIPYMIIPRSSLTRQAMNNHSKWKKRLAHFFIFDKYVHRAASIQYLTEDEYRDSGGKWNKNHFILPNGFAKPLFTKENFSKGALKATFIGRLDMYQKGIDVLLEACSQMQDELRKVNFSMCFYGPKRYQYDLILQSIQERGMQDFVTMGGEISGKAKEDLLLSTDLFVLTSRFEGHPMGLIEALSYGVPAFVTPGSNMAKEIQEYDAGWACKDLSVEEIKEMLRVVIQEQYLLEKKSKNAMSLVKPYDWSILAEKFHEEAEKIIINYR